MIVPNDTVIAVADGGRLRLFRNRAAEPRIDLEELAGAQLETNNEGSGARHRNSPANPDRTRLEEDDHASAIADHLNRNVLGGAIENLVVIADPRTLGEMRRSFHPATAAVLIGEIARDLTGHSIDKIEDALGRP